MDWDTLFDHGLALACDECDTPGLSSADGWLLLSDGRTLCAPCQVREALVDSRGELTIKGHATVETGRWVAVDDTEKTQLEKLYSRGFTRAKYDKDGSWVANAYECRYCVGKWMLDIWGLGHTVSSVPHHLTNNSSCWGAGIPTTRRECSVCKRWDGPWVSSDYVGGY